jgi:hypothetical protein
MEFHDISWKDDASGSTGSCPVYVTPDTLNPVTCSPSPCISLTPVLFYKLNDLIKHLDSVTRNGFHMNTPHPIFIPQRFSRGHTLLCTQMGMHEKLDNICAFRHRALYIFNFGQVRYINMESTECYYISNLQMLFNIPFEIAQEIESMPKHACTRYATCFTSHTPTAFSHGQTTAQHKSE